MITVDNISDFQINVLLDVLDAAKAGLEMNSGKSKKSKKAQLFHAASVLSDYGFFSRKHKFGCTVFTITESGRELAQSIITAGKSVKRMSEAQRVRQATRTSGKYSAINGYCDHCERPKAVTYYHEETDSEICSACLADYKASHESE